MNINHIYHGHALDILKTFPDNSVDMCVTSPPYYGLRAYNSEPVIWQPAPQVGRPIKWETCKHEWGNEHKVNRHKKGESNPGKEHWYKEKDGINSTAGNFCIHCNAWKGELGLEPTYQLYIFHLKLIFAEVKRVVKDTGTIWVNIGDSYGNGKGHCFNPGGGTDSFQDYLKKNSVINCDRPNKSDLEAMGIQPKSLLQIPERFSIMMTDELGLIKRNTIIWFKKNCMPSSANDRFTVDFEPIYFYSLSSETAWWTNWKTMQMVDKQPPGLKGIEGSDWIWIECQSCKGKGCNRCDNKGEIKKSCWEGHDYYFEQQFEEQITSKEIADSKWKTRRELRGKEQQEGIYHDAGNGTPFKNYNPLGRNKRTVWPFDSAQSLDLYSWLRYLQDKLPEGLFIEILQDLTNKGTVWQINTEPFAEAHFAVFPQALVETPIKAGCPEFICNKCGKPREKIYEKTGEIKSYGGKRTISDVNNNSPSSVFSSGNINQQKFIGYTDCGCTTDSPDRFHPGIVLDPFIGSGTTAIVAKKLNRDYIGIDIKSDYINMSNKRSEKELGILF